MWTKGAHSFQPSPLTESDLLCQPKLLFEVDQSSLKELSRVMHESVEQEQQEKSLKYNFDFAKDLPEKPSLGSDLWASSLLRKSSFQDSMAESETKGTYEWEPFKLAKAKQVSCYKQSQESTGLQNQQPSAFSLSGTDTEKNMQTPPKKQMRGPNSHN